MRATSDWVDEPEAVGLAKFRTANQGAPQVLIVSSSNEDGSALANKLGYRDCTEDRAGRREISACKVATELSAVQD
jgi:hypothetical protein